MKVVAGAALVVLVGVMDVVVLNVVVVTGEGSVTKSGGLMVTMAKLSRNRKDNCETEFVFLQTAHNTW